jgi:hypothetical protein
MKIADQGYVFDASAAPPNQRCCNFTEIASLSDGRILVCFRAGSSKDAADENLLIRESSDDGKNWKTVFSGFDKTVNGTPGGWRHGALTELQQGRLIGAFCWFDRSDPGRPLANPQTQGTLPSRIFIMDSVDGGRTWVNRRELNYSPYEGVATTGGVLRLVDGALALPAEAWKSYYDAQPGKHHSLLWLSNDGGHTFDQSVITAHDPDARLFYWDRRISVEPETGRLLALYWTHDRTSGQDANVHVGWGSPAGKDWTNPVDAGFAGQISGPLALGSCRGLAAYVHRHYPPTLRAVLTEDFGKSWDVAHEEVFYESGAGRESGIGGKRDFGDYWADMNLWNFGHPVAARLPNGDVFIAFYAGDARAMSIRWVRIKL